MKGISILAIALVASLAHAAPAQADFSSFLAVTCGPQCDDPIGEQTKSSENWRALRAMGTTDYIGASVDGVPMDPGGLLAAARQVGALELDRWLRTGAAATPDVVTDIMAALRAGYGTDVYRVVGNFKVGDQAMLETSKTEFPTLNLAAFQATTVPGLGPGGGSSAYCDQTIDSAQNASAQNYVNEVMEAAYSDQYGFSQVGGLASGSNSHSPSGLFGGSCLDLFMQGDKDTLFRPPQLPQLLSMLTQMFGKAGGPGMGGGMGGMGGGQDGACAGAPTVFQQVENSMPSAVFTPGRGGFHPTTEYAGTEEAPNGLVFSNNFGIDQGMFQTGGTNSNLLGIF